MTAIIYLINNYFLKSYTSGILNYFCICYLNDLICPLLLLSYSNILLLAVHKEINTFTEAVFICFLCGLVWEFLTPVLKSNSTTDLFDIFCYCLGGMMYISIQKINFKIRLNRQKD